MLDRREIHVSRIIDYWVSGWEFKYNNKYVSVDIPTLNRDTELISSISFYLNKFTVAPNS
jgi:hypothetical protein